MIAQSILSDASSKSLKQLQLVLLAMCSLWLLFTANGWSSRLTIVLWFVSFISIHIILSHIGFSTYRADKGVVCQFFVYIYNLYFYGSDSKPVLFNTILPSQIFSNPNVMTNTCYLNEIRYLHSNIMRYIIILSPIL